MPITPKLDLEEERLALRKRVSASLFEFCRDIMGYQDMHPPLHDDVMGKFLTTWTPGKDIKTMLVPRGHLKTSIASVAMPIWIWLNDPDARIMMCHGKRDIAIQFGTGLKRQLEENELLHWIAPDIFYKNPRRESPQWHQDKFSIRRPTPDQVPSMVLTGTDSSVVGLHFNYHIFDDLVFRENVGTAEMRRKTLQHFQQSRALRRPGCKAIIIGTRWHWDDMYSVLIDEHGPYRNTAESLVLHCGYPGEPIFPKSARGGAGYTKKDLEDLKETMRGEFNSQYMNDPTPDTDNLFQREKIRFFDFDQQGRVPTDKALTFYTAVDPNRSIKTKDDPCVVMTAARDEDNNIWVVDISVGHPTGPEIVDWIRTHVQRWSPRKVIVETNNFQMQLVHWLREDMQKHDILYNIHEATRGPSTKKYDRISAMEPMVRMGMLRVRKGLDSLVTELEHYPSWKNDDQADALADIFAYGLKPQPVKEKVAVKYNPFQMGALLDDVYKGHRHSIGGLSL